MPITDVEFADLTIPASTYTVLGPGDGWNIFPGRTLTILGGLDAPRTQIFFFPGDGTGKVRLITGAATGTAGTPEVYPEFFGAVVNDGSDCLPAFNKMLAAFEGSNPNYGYGGCIRLSPGTYRFSDTWVINRQVRVTGPSGGWGYGVTTLQFDVGKSGIVVYKPGETVENAGNADFCTLEQFTIRSADKGGLAAVPCDGITCQGRATIRNVYVEGWSRHGIVIDGTLRARSPANTRIECCRIYDCGTVDIWTAHDPPYNFFTGPVLIEGHGVWAATSEAGSETSVCYINADVAHNSGRGCQDDGAYGNIWVGCMSHSNRGGPFGSGGGSTTYNRSVWIGCYSESDSPPSDFAASSAIVIGGHHGAGIIGNAEILTGDQWRLLEYLTLGLERDVLDPAAGTDASLSPRARLVASIGDTLRRYMLAPFPGGQAAYFQAYPRTPGPCRGAFSHGRGNSPATDAVGLEALGDQENTANAGASYGVIGRARGGAENWALYAAEGDLYLPAGRLRLGDWWLSVDACGRLVVTPV